MRLRSRAARRAGLNVLGVLVALVTLFPIALALILTVILLIITVGYVRGSVRQGATR